MTAVTAVHSTVTDGCTACRCTVRAVQPKDETGTGDGSRNTVAVQTVCTVTVDSPITHRYRISDASDTTFRAGNLI